MIEETIKWTESKTPRPIPEKDGMYIVGQKDPHSKSIAITNCIFNKQL